MKVNIQTMKNAKYSVEVAPTDTVLALKTMIHAQHQLADPEEQKLIHVGKILKDDQTMDTANIADNANIVIMITKKKPTPASTPAAAQTTSATAPTVDSQPAPTVAVTTAPPAVSTAAAAPASVPSPSAASSASSLVTGPAYEEALTNLMSFGFPREQVVTAMRAAFNNADRAAEYLFSGIPAGALAQAEAAERRTSQPAVAAAQPATASPVAAAPEAGAAPAGGAGVAAVGGLDLSTLGDLTQLRALLTANPQMLPLLLGQLAESHPQLLQQLEDNPQAFLQLIQALGIDPTTLPGVQALVGGGGGGGDRVTIELNEAERAQIENLVLLGFPRNAAVEAWLLCDRDQEMAAAYLLEHGAELAAMGDDAGFLGDDMMDEHGHGDEEGDDDDDFDPNDYME